jgi:hypothetical protein
MGKNKQPKEEKEEYSVYDKIVRGTFVLSIDKFWDHLFHIFPELSADIVNIKMQSAYGFSTEEETNELFSKDKAKFKYAIFTPETLKEYGMLPASFNLKGEVERHKVIIPNSKADAILEVDRVGKHNAIVTWYLIERKF